MKQLLIILAILLSTLSFAQTKYLIYFKDKGISQNEDLQKTSSFYQSAINELSERSITRRIKNIGKDNFLSYEDIPVYPEYIHTLETAGIKIKNKLKWFNAISASLTETQVNIVREFDFVEKIEPVKIIMYKSETQFPFDDQVEKSLQELPINYGPSFGQLQLSDVPEVHAVGITGEGVLVGMLDTGFDWKDHEALENAGIIAEYDFINDDSVTANENNDPPSQHEHGTLTFSVIGGYKDSTLIGASFGSDFLLAKTEDVNSETHIEEDNYAAALEWMENSGVDITSSSLGYSEFDDSVYSYSYSDMDGNTTIVTRACELAFSKGVVSITSAGNEGNNTWFYITAPADGFNTIGVGAVDSENQIRGFSGRGPTYDGRIKPDVVARGTSVFGAFASGFTNYGTASGTSMSAPIAAGIASLLLSAHPHLKNTQVRNILLETADNSSSPNNERGYGLLLALDAVEFPNLEETSGSFKLHKIVISTPNFDPQTFSIHYSVNGANSEPVQMDYNGNRTFNYIFPILTYGDSVEFYFAFSDSSGNSFRLPQRNNYKFAYGQLEIVLNLKLQPVTNSFLISEIYPNPFLPAETPFTRIAINSSGNEKLRVAIIDGSGQQVKVFETITTERTNYFSWDGISDRGILCASGVYYYLIRLGNENFGRKMILLK